MDLLLGLKHQVSAFSDFFILKLYIARKNVNIDTAFHFLVSHIMKITKNMTLQTQGQNNLGDHKKTELNVVGATQSSNFDKNDKDKENETTSSNKKGCCY